ncbi:MAG: cation diffusion facilitator family transporter [Sphingobium sp.]
MNTLSPPDFVQKSRLTQRAAVASVTVATLLLALKSYALWKTESVAMLGSLADTALDLVASIVTLFGVRLAATPADHDHRFGHGKAEALASLFQVSLISIAAVGIAAESISRIGAYHFTSAPEMGIGVSVMAIVLSFALIAYQRHVIMQTGSLAIGADNLHYKSDLYLNVSVIVALALDHYMGIRGVDPLFGIVIALWLGWGAWHSASKAIDHLMDKEWSIEERQRFLEIAEQHPALHGIHDMRTRTSGADRFVQFHASVDPNITVRQAHIVMDEIEEQLMAEFPGVEILIHPDPDDHVEGDHDDLRARDAVELLREEEQAQPPTG